MAWCMVMVLLTTGTVVDPALLQARFDVGTGGRIFPAPNVETLLVRPWEAHVPMACVGEALWAGHPSGWGFPNDTHFFLPTAHGVGFDLDFRTFDQPLSPREGRAYPSHTVLQGAVHHLRAGGAKWITEDDVLVAEIVLTNTSTHPIYVDAHLALPAKALEEAGGHLAWQTDVAGVPVHLFASAPGFEVASELARPQAQYSAEGEAPHSQEGGDTEPRAGASGGAVLGHGFGRAAGGFAQWHIDVPAALADAVLSIRYARDRTDPAVFRLTAASLDTSIALPGTGGWGDTASHFTTARYALGALDAGTVSVRLEALEAKADASIDFVAIHPSRQSAALPSPGAQMRVRRLEVAANESQTVRVAVAASGSPSHAQAALARVMGLEKPLAAHRAAYTGWLTKNVPAFTSENEALEKVYWHRAASVLRKNLTRPGLGRLDRWAMASGRWRSAWHPNIISRGAAHQIREMRWLRNPGYVHDYIETWCAHQREDGLFPSHIPPVGDLPAGQYADWITASVWDALAVHPAAEKRAEWLPALRRNVDGWLARYDTEDSHLLTVDSHAWAGLPWQPSFFHAAGGERGVQEQPLARAGLTSFVFGGAQAVSRLLAAEGDAEGAQRYAGLAGRIQRALRQHCWDVETSYFYPVTPDTHERIMVKEVEGLYPFYFSMFDATHMARYAEAFATLIDPGAFWTPWPAAAATRQPPSGARESLTREEPGGACLWNAPTWPYANSLVLPALGRVLRDYAEPPVEAGHFQRLFMTYTMAQFREQDLTFPWTGEFYQGDTGEWCTGERDHNDSTYLDLIITELAGLRVRDDDILELRPLIDGHTPGFIIDGLRYRGHDLTIAWTRWRAAKPGPDGRRGLRIYANGELVFAARDEVMPTAVYRDMADGFRAVLPPAE